MSLNFSILVPSYSNTFYATQFIRDKLGFLQDFAVVVSSEKGLGKARNSLAKDCPSDYLLFLDASVSFSEKVFDLYIKPSVVNKRIVAVAGENGVMCTRVFGIPRKLFFKVGGFDETMNVGEDLEMGCRLKKLGLSFQLIPNDAINDFNSFHCGNSYLKGLAARVKIGLRYDLKELFFPPARKRDWVAFPVTVSLLCYYLCFGNKRINISHEFC